jgi:chromosome segregation ATPase
MNVRSVERALQQQSQSLKTETLEESSAADLAGVEVENKERLLENQKRKLEAVQQLKDLPPEVTIHEQEVLKQRSAELQKAQAEYQQASAKLSAATNARNEKLTALAAALQQARANHQLALAKLQSKRDSRAFTEYEASITAARRAEEKNQAQQSYYRQLQSAEQQQRDRSFQLAQINAKVAEVDDKLRTLSVVTSPYTGIIRRVKVLQQTDNNLSVELTLVVDDERERSTTAATSTTNRPPTFNPVPFTSSPSR